MYEEFDTQSSHDMATAHIVIKCKSDYQKDVMEQLRSIEGIVEILEVIGEYDILAKIETTSSESLKRIIKWKILHHNEKITSVITLLCMRKPLCIIVK
ncbi:Lrp/AsnC ligand binding domain-containing protein [Candidatus Nitrosotalea bavarica]|jgi:DNA-binding Lrp family transcriptional regulator|uniref:Lrp/AsnC ligand binding domain-containing protein n=1 Tax=Candidatus Nitrosotalea bavarica TaxID=1903277 RepID=UPI000C70F6AF|nr:Lrp/AsnC ligand binding domain-containing protein [Candidatus Nitrosotalea bavarica]